MQPIGGCDLETGQGDKNQEFLGQSKLDIIASEGCLSQGTIPEGVLK